MNNGCYYNIGCYTSDPEIFLKGELNPKIKFVLFEKHLK